MPVERGFHAPSVLLMQNFKRLNFMAAFPPDANEDKPVTTHSELIS